MIKKYIQEKNDTPVIDDVIWNDAKEKVFSMYADSNILDVVKKSNAKKALL